AIRQDRTVNLRPFCSYREYVGLKAPRTFSEVTTDPEAAEFLGSVYRKPEHVDFYVGLFAEQTVESTPLPPLILRMVALDAFSQAFTNPLLSEHVFHAGTFSAPGWQAIMETHTLEELVDRNSPGTSPPGLIRMTIK